MAELKTKPTTASVAEYLNTIEPERKREDSFALLEMMREETGEEPVMWGDSIVGFGRYHYVYETGNEGDWFEAGFAPRSRNLTLYLMAGFDGVDALMGQLGKHKTGRSCLYINKLADIDEAALRELIRRSVRHIRETYPAAGS